MRWRPEPRRDAQTRCLLLVLLLLAEGDLPEVGRMVPVLPPHKTLIPLYSTPGGRNEAARAIEMADGPLGFLPAASL